MATSPSSEEFVFEKSSKIFCDAFSFQLQALPVEDLMSRAYENFKINLDRVQVFYAKQGEIKRFIVILFNVIAYLLGCLYFKNHTCV